MRYEKYSRAISAIATQGFYHVFIMTQHHIKQTLYFDVVPSSQQDMRALATNIFLDFKEN